MKVKVKILPPWQPIASAPKNRYILMMSHETMLADIVTWKYEWVNNYGLYCPSGWFKFVSTGEYLRSNLEDVSNLYWMDIPPISTTGKMGLTE